MTLAYTDEQWEPVIEMMRHLPLDEIEPQVPMSLFSLRKKRHELGMPQVLRKPIGPRGMKKKEVNRLIMKMGGEVAFGKR